MDPELGVLELAVLGVGVLPHRYCDIAAPYDKTHHDERPVGQEAVQDSDRDHQVGDHEERRGKQRGLALAVHHGYGS